MFTLVLFLLFDCGKQIVHMTHHSNHLSIPLEIMLLPSYHIKYKYDFSSPCLPESMLTLPISIYMLTLRLSGRYGHCSDVNSSCGSYYKIDYGLRQDYSYEDGEIITSALFVKGTWRPLLTFSLNVLSHDLCGFWWQFGATVTTCNLWIGMNTEIWKTGFLN